MPQRELTQFEYDYYRSALENSFEIRLYAQVGDGVLRGLDEDRTDRYHDKSTIRVMFHGEPHLFVYIEFVSGICIVPEKALKEPDDWKQRLFIRNDVEELEVLKQLLVNEWIHVGNLAV